MLLVPFLFERPNATQRQISGPPVFRLSRGYCSSKSTEEIETETSSREKQSSLSRTTLENLEVVKENCNSFTKLHISSEMSSQKDKSQEQMQNNQLHQMRESETPQSFLCIVCSRPQERQSPSEFNSNAATSHLESLSNQSSFPA